MTDEQRILRALEELSESDHTPEQVCGDDPVLLAAVREHWDRLRWIDNEIESLFPTPQSLSSGGAHSRAHHRSRHDTPHSRPLPQISGYTVESVLGSGGMGVVYRATHLKLKRTIAIKMLRSGVYSTPQELACLLREAQAVAALRHDHIVHIYDVGELDGLPYFTMEYVEGETLARHMNGVPQPARRAAELVSTLAAAMESAHQRGVVHRDLKPSNILLTREGSPKIADFSLARSTAGESQLTLSAARVGTPSYMAPEQAMGTSEAFAPAVDIYALGAVLYEALTGRPPFKAETAVETQRQVLTQEPAPPSRLNARVPRDLETICLKALHKDPRRRYTTCAAMADDLLRYLKGEPITARAVGPLERATKWLRRHPGRAVGITAALVIASGLVALSTVAAINHGRVARQVTEDLDRLDRARAAADWNGARAAVAQARARLGEEGNARLRERIDLAERDLDLVARVDAIRLKRVPTAEWRTDRAVMLAAADRNYEAAFRSAGLLVGQTDEAPAVAARVSASAVRPVLIAVLDDWAVCNAGLRNRDRLAWLLDIARRADAPGPGESDWKQRVRDADVWSESSGDRLAALVEQMPAGGGEHSLSLLTAVGERLVMVRRLSDAVPFLTRVQHLHPADFWVNYTLAVAVGESSPSTALRYSQAAVAIRPDAASARTTLGIALGTSGQLDEALSHLREAIRLDPDLAFTYDGLGNVLTLQGKAAEAEEAYRKAIKLNPRIRSPHNNLANLMSAAGRLKEAEAEYRAALELDPEHGPVRSSLGLLLRKQGRLDEALVECERAVRDEPARAASHLNLGLVLKDLQRRDEAIDSLRRAIALDPNDPEIHTSLGSALTLAPGHDASEAEASFNEALRIDPRYVPAFHGLGVLAGEERDFDRAIEMFKKALEIDPRYAASRGGIGRAFMLQGKYQEARDALQVYLDALAPTDPRAKAVAKLIRECEKMNAPDGK
ncbi:MAG: tetratricopeptide repeat protein [Phycisphaerales bacterium]